MVEDVTTINVGKEGISDSLVAEIKTHIRKRGRVRVKFLKSARSERSRGDLACELAGKSSAKVVFSRGNIIILEDRKRCRKT